MVRTGAAVLLVLGLVGCSGGPSSTPSTAGAPSATPAALSFPEPGTGTLDPDKAKVLQEVLAKVVSMPDIESGARGVTAAVVTDQWTWSGAAGVDARGTTLVPASSMAVASITKTFVASEVMLLAKAHKVDLDAPLATYVKHKLTANNATVRQHLSMTSGVPNYLPNAGLAADAPTVARWGYQLYGGRVLPADLVADMTKGDGDYGLGTMLFSQQFGPDPAYGHRGDLPDHSSLLIVIPAKKLAVALLLADGNKHVDTTMTELLTAVQPLLG